MGRWAWLLGLAACGGDDGAAPISEVGAPRAPAPAVQAGTPTLRRLTTTQYQATLVDLFGPTLIVPTALEPDVPVDGMVSIGAAVAGLSARGVEQYEDAAWDVAAQLVDPSVAERVYSCRGAGVVDEACAREIVSGFGQRVYRRPLTPAEVDALVAVAASAGETFGSFDVGIQYAVGAMLQSPAFLYRVELGEPDPDAPGARRYTSWEMASRLSYLLWQTMPDDALLDAAASGAVVTEAGLAEAVDRLLADPRARTGVRALFQDILQLGDDLDAVSKDPFVYNAWSVDLIASAREQTLREIEALVVDDDADWRSLLISQRTFVDRRLAALYGVEAPVIDGFGEVELPAAGGRRGLLGHASFLLLKSHATTTSVTRRGLYIQERLLCTDLPDPPAGLNTAIPEPSEDAPTMRDRVEVHLTVPECAACHELMDPLGLGLETFDGVGQWRTTENGVTIDASGALAGVPFADAWSLAQVVHDNPALSPCLALHIFEAATGRVPSAGEEEWMAWHTDGFADEGHRVRWLLRDLLLSPAFRQVGVVP